MLGLRLHVLCAYAPYSLLAVQAVTHRTTERRLTLLRSVSDAYDRRWLTSVFGQCLENEAGCWIWQGNRTRNGYGQKFYPDRGNSVVHRKVLEIVSGQKLGRWEYACHSCDVKLCCNPDHLWKGTPKENQEDSVRKRRNGEQQVTHCPRGHEYSSDNITWKVAASGRPARECRECNRARMSRRYHRRAAEFLARGLTVRGTPRTRA